MNPLVKALGCSTNYASLLKKIKAKENSKLSITGLTDSSKAWMVYGITENSDKSSLVICNNMFI